MSEKTVTLRFPNFGKPFRLHMDASGIAMGAALSQENGPLEFFSRVLSQAEVNYSATDREFCSLVAALKKLQYIIHGYPVTVFTDHSSLTHMIEDRPPLNGRHARYLMEIADYDLIVRHIADKQNIAAEFLSRCDVQEAPKTQAKALNPFVRPFYSNVRACCSAKKTENATEDITRKYHESGQFQR